MFQAFRFNKTENWEDEMYILEKGSIMEFYNFYKCLVFMHYLYSF